MIYNFDELPERRSTESVKWNYFGDDVLPMWVADMDFVSPQPVIQALRERIAHGVFGYPGELAGLRETIVEKLEKRYQWKVSPDALVFIPGVVTGINMAAHAVLPDEDGCNPGGVLVQTPVYTPFLGVGRNVNGTRQETELTRGADGSYRIDFDAFENAITDQTRMFLMSNPHNPVGRVFTRHELERMAEICLRHKLVICSDEIHCDLIFSGHKHIPIASLDPEIEQNTITLMAPSKTFNIAGLVCSFAVIPNPDLRRIFCQSNRGLVHGVNLLGLVAARAAYQEGQEWLDQLLVYLEGNRDLLYNFVKEHMPGVKMARAEGTYLAWMDFSETGVGDKPCEFFIEKAKVATNDGASFGKGGKGFIRLNFGCPRSMLQEALERMREALAHCD